MAAKPLPSPEVLRQLLSYDPDTGKLFWKERGPEWFKDGLRPAEWCANQWNNRFSGAVAGTLTPRGYLKVTVNSEKYWAHRVAWKIYYGCEPLFEIDHINQVKDDNRIENLRDVAPSINSKNSPIGTRNISGVVGVFWNTQKQKWQAKIHCNGKGRHIGFFDDLPAAQTARKQAERELGFHPNHGS